MKWFCVPCGAFPLQLETLLKSFFNNVFNCSGNAPISWPSFFQIGTYTWIALFQFGLLFTIIPYKKMFCKVKDPIPKNENIGVYRITCGDCCAVYIRETGRKSRIRFNEHITAFAKNRSHDSAVGAHLLVCEHAIDNIDVVLLHEGKSFNKRSTFDTLEIYKHRAKNYNQRVHSRTWFSRKAVCVIPYSSCHCRHSLSLLVFFPFCSSTHAVIRVFSLFKFVSLTMTNRSKVLVIFQ